MLQARNNGRGQGISSEGKKKRSDQDTSEAQAILKRPKQESSAVSSPKVLGPQKPQYFMSKLKNGDPPCS